MNRFTDRAWLRCDTAAVIEWDASKGSPEMAKRTRIAVTVLAMAVGAIGLAMASGATQRENVVEGAAKYVVDVDNQNWRQNGTALLLRSTGTAGEVVDVFNQNPRQNPDAPQLTLNVIAAGGGVDVFNQNPNQNPFAPALRTVPAGQAEVDIWNQNPNQNPSTPALRTVPAGEVEVEVDIWNQNPNQNPLVA